MSGDLASVAIGVVLGWHLLHARTLPIWHWGLRLLGAVGALLLLSALGVAHSFLTLFGLALGLAAHGLLVAFLKKRETEG
jgi:hypothetical protein